MINKKDLINLCGGNVSDYHSGKCDHIWSWYEVGYLRGLNIDCNIGRPMNSKNIIEYERGLIDGKGDLNFV